MAFRRRKSARKRNVRWLPNNSFLSDVSSIRANFAGGPFNSGTFTKDLILGGGNSVPTALDVTGGLPSPANAARTNTDNLIIDHISGQVFWGLEGAGNDGDQDASGTWIWAIRMAILILPMGTSFAGGNATAEELDGVGGDSIHSLDPGANINWVLQGSFGPDGLRCLWRRSWMLVTEFSADVTDQNVNVVELTPPAGYVDIKPKRLLKGNDRLVVASQVTALPGTGAAGYAKYWWSHDLRPAAHTTMRRR